jgi:molecular chaperone DnaK (HSP70)
MEVAGQPYVFCTTRFDLDQLFGVNLAAARELSALCLQDAATSPDGVDAAVVTGLPFSTAMLQERFGEAFPRLADLRRWVVDPGLAAEGTAQHAARLREGLPALPVPPELRGVVRSTLFLVLRDAGTGGRKFEKLFDAGQTLPASVRRQVHLAGRGVERVVVAIAVAGREAEEPTLVGNLELAVPAEARELGALDIEIVHETSAELVVRGLASGQEGPRSIALPMPSIGHDRLALRRLSWIRQVGFLGSAA